MQVSGKDHKEEKGEGEHGQRFDLHIPMCTCLLFSVLNNGKLGVVTVKRRCIFSKSLSMSSEHTVD